ncbi:hypothetical protein [Streptomyces sp. NPDC048057]|uniref:hypothetical protein n=1 Tax=Streptomyces sp. NPDC048057 TaxID=3155628 RepID=UPI0033EC818F
MSPSPASMASPPAHGPSITPTLTADALAVFTNGPVLDTWTTRALIAGLSGSPIRPSTATAARVTARSSATSANAASTSATAARP